MSNRKKRTKTKKASNQANPKKLKELESVSAEEYEETEEEVVEKEAEKAVQAKVAEESKTPKAEKKEPKPKKETVASKHLHILQNAQESFEQGNYKKAQNQLVQLLESNPSAEETEKAKDLLGRMEIDLRTLLIGATGMVMFLLIQTIGFVKALWMLPVLFLVLLVDPKLFGLAENAD